MGRKTIGRASAKSAYREEETICLCVFCVGLLCGPPLRWWVPCGDLPSVWVPCGWAPPLSCSRFPWHLLLVLPLVRAHALAVNTSILVSTRYCYYQYCTVYITIKGFRGGLYIAHSCVR